MGAKVNPLRPFISRSLIVFVKGLSFSIQSYDFSWIL
nr:MAG TPA: hypothetical protein [Microviridae sp.]